MIEGMTLRDYFAAQSLKGFIQHDFHTPTHKQIAEACYNLADAMIEKRGKEPDNILHSKIRDKLVRQLRELKELQKKQTHNI
jgi:hypothetical protein